MKPRKMYLVIYEREPDDWSETDLYSSRGRAETAIALEYASMFRPVDKWLIVPVVIQPAPQKKKRNGA